MRYICPKCGATYAVKPETGTCRNCDATLVVDSVTHEAEPHGERDGMPSPKRRL